MNKVKPASNKIGIVSATFNKRVHYHLKLGALKALNKVHQHFQWIEVPGVVEIPLTAGWLFEQQCEVVIALGAIIRGQTSHFNACCRLVETGCMSVQLKVMRPIIFGILMTDNEHQAMARAGGAKGNIGQTAVSTALAMLNIKHTLTK